MVWYYEVVSQIICTHVQIDKFLWYTVQQNFVGSEISKFFKKTEIEVLDIKCLSFTKKHRLKSRENSVWMRNFKILWFLI